MRNFLIVARIVLAVIAGLITMAMSMSLIVNVLEPIFSTITPHILPLPDGMAINDPLAQNTAIARIVVPLFTILAISILFGSFLGATVARKISKGTKFTPWIVVAWPMIVTIITLTSSLISPHGAPLYGLIGIGACGLLLPVLGVYLAQKFTRPFLFAPTTA